MREVFSLGAKDLVMSAQPGYLQLSPEQERRLIRKDPIQDYYEVEDQPFARGKYATVRRCRCRQTGRQYAAKVLRKRRRSADFRPEILHEIAVLEACKQSSRIVRLHEVFESNIEMVLLLELACGGELQTLLDRDQVPSERQVVRLMRQILDGLVHLHDLNVAHLDIKPQNLVLTGEFPDCDVKLCDFGISRYLGQGVDVREILGTPDYVAPEVLDYNPISLATDMWSVGVLTYVLLTGCSPFGGDTKQETFCNITQCRLDFPDDLFGDISEVAKDFMRKLMVKNPSNRLTVRECLQQPWFAREASESKTSNLSTEAKPSKPRTPVPSKRPIPINDESSDVETPVILQKSKLVNETPIKESSSSFPKTKTLSDQNKNKGLSAERRKSFNKNMENLIEKLEAESMPKNEDLKKCEEKPLQNKNNGTEFNTERSRSVTRANGMQTMPVSSLLRYNRGNSVLIPEQACTYALNRDVDRESVFKYRRIFIMNEIEDQSPPPSINGSLSSDNSSISDSNSDTISEMSIDSSSDRSSIISLDDPYDFPFGKGLSHSRNFTSCYNVWEASRSPKTQIRLPRECNGSFARAFSRFATQNKNLKEGAFIKQQKTLTVFNGNPSTSSPTNEKKCVGLELMQERNGNIVVIREVKAVNGSRYPRCSEVKCESVQSRIRRLQVQNGLKTELSKDNYNIF